MQLDSYSIQESYEPEFVFSIGDILQWGKAEKVRKAPVQVSFPDPRVVVMGLFLLTAVSHYLPIHSQTFPYSLLLILSFIIGWGAAMLYCRHMNNITSLTNSDEQEIIDEINRLFEK